MNKPTTQRDPKMDWGFHAVLPRIIRTEYKNLTPLQRWFYVCLKDLCGEHGTCYRTVRVLVEETGISAGMISESIPVLHDAGLIHAEKKRRHTGGKEVWHITIIDIWHLNGKIHPTKRSQDEQSCSSCEQSTPNQDVQQVNVHPVNNGAEECSAGEQECSLCETEAVSGSSIRKEAVSEGTFPRDLHTSPSGADAPTHTLEIKPYEPALEAGHPIATATEGPHTSAHSGQRGRDSGAGHAVGHSGAEPGAGARSGKGTEQANEIAPAEKPPHRARQPKPPKVDRSEVTAYLDMFDRLFQEVTGEPDAGYVVSEVDRKELVSLLSMNAKKPGYVTPEKLRRVYLRMWKKPRDAKTGFCWQDHMKIKNVCKQYPQEAMELAREAKAKQASTTIIGFRPLTAPIVAIGG